MDKGLTLMEQNTLRKYINYGFQWLYSKFLDIERVKVFLDETKRVTKYIKYGSPVIV